MIEREALDHVLTKRLLIGTWAAMVITVQNLIRNEAFAGAFIYDCKLAVVMLGQIREPYP